jgi:VWFA-related protein
MRCELSPRNALLVLLAVAGVYELVSPAASQQAPVAAPFARFVSPAPGEIVAGWTQVRLEVRDPLADQSRVDRIVERIDVSVEGVPVGSALPPGFSFSWMAPAAGLGGAALRAEVVSAGRVVEVLSLPTGSVRIDDTTEVLAVELLPAVLAAGGTPVRGLSHGDFQVLDDGEPARITTFADDGVPLSVAFLLDRSVSMSGRLDGVRESAVRFVRLLAPTDSVAVWAFDHALLRLAPWEQGAHESAIAGLLSLEPRGGTSLNDALVAVLGELRDVPGRKLLIVLSDGRDVRSTNRPADVLDHARAAHAAIHVLSTATNAEEAGRDDLELLAFESGGRFVRVSGARDLDRALSGLLDEARSRYALTFAPASMRPGEHRVTVLVRGGAYEVRHRRGFVVGAR